MERFRYEFDFYKIIEDYREEVNLYILIGYIFLNQFVRQEPFHLTNEEIKQVFEDFLENDENVSTIDNILIFELKSVDKETLSFIKMILKYMFVQYSEINVENNLIKIYLEKDEN